MTEVGVLNEKYFQKTIFQIETDRKCRLCKKLDETREHIVGKQTILTEPKFMKWH